MAERTHNKKTFTQSPRKRRAVFVLKILGGLFLIGVFFCVAVFIYYAKDLPRPERFTERQFVQSTKIFDKTGEVLLYEIYGEEKRTLVSLDHMSDNLKHAVLAAEDSNFYEHFGFDFNGFFRSVWLNVTRRTIQSLLYV